MELEAATENIRERVILWQDHVNDAGYRATLTMILFPNNERCLELSCGGTVTRLKYVFPYSTADRL